jgi:hypothetical protein
MPWNAGQACLLANVCGAFQVRRLVRLAGWILRSLSTCFVRSVSMVTSTPQPQASPNAAPANASYRPEIDGLRALAVIVVIVNHFQKSLLPSGYLGGWIFSL